MGIADEIALLVLQSSTCSARNAQKRAYKQYMVAKSEGLQCSLVDRRCWIMVNPCPIESMISISVSPIGSDLPLDPPITIVIVCCVLWIKHTKKIAIQYDRTKICTIHTLIKTTKPTSVPVQRPNSDLLLMPYYEWIIYLITNLL